MVIEFDFIQACKKNSKHPLMVFFYSSFCPHCIKIQEIIEYLGTNKYKNAVTLINIDVDADPDLVAKYEVHTVPTVLFITDEGEHRYIGPEIDFMEGDFSNFLSVQKWYTQIRGYGLERDGFYEPTEVTHLPIADLVETVDNYHEFMWNLVDYNKLTKRYEVLLWNWVNTGHIRRYSSSKIHLCLPAEWTKGDIVAFCKACVIGCADVLEIKALSWNIDLLPFPVDGSCGLDKNLMRK